MGSNILNEYKTIIFGVRKVDVVLILAIYYFLTLIRGIEFHGLRYVQQNGRNNLKFVQNYVNVKKIIINDKIIMYGLIGIFIFKMRLKILLTSVYLFVRSSPN